MTRRSWLVAIVVATTTIAASTPQALADSPEPAPGSSTIPPPLLRPLPSDPPQEFPVQHINGAPQTMVFITTSTDGASIDIDGKEFVLASDVLFAYNKATLTRRAQTLLNQIVDKLESKRPRALQISGHTDSDGTAAHNRRLSRQRAVAVHRYLTAHLSIEVPITTHGWGESKPRFDNNTKAGRAANRRVEIAVTP